MNKIICAAMFAIISTAALADDPDAFVIGDPNCRIENPNPRQNERATWDGPCKDGYADGPGALQWYLNDKPSSRYEGDMDHGLPNGNGVYVYASNTRYEGGFAKGKMNGQGTLTRPDGYKLVATFENNKAVGIVEIVYASGESYKGMYKNNEREGQGHMIYTDGFIYDGEWKNGKRSGHGILTGPNGYKLIGTFEDDLAQGDVELHCATGALYEGMYKNGQPDGSGRMTYSDGVTYTGEWKQGKREGHGHLEYVDGAKYDGDFKNDLYDGKGVMNYSDGGKYEGSFKSGLFDGEGIINYRDGRKYEGSFKNGKFVGKSVIHYSGDLKNEGLSNVIGRLAVPTGMSKEEVQAQLAVVDERISRQIPSLTSCQNSSAYHMSRTADAIVELQRIPSVISRVDIQELLNNLFTTYKSMGGSADEPAKVVKTADPCQEIGDQLKSDIDAETALQNATDKFGKEPDSSFKRAVINFASCNKPDYPRISLYLEQQGTVRIAFLIGAYGLVDYSFVAISSGTMVLDDVAREALSKCHFVAGSKNGQPISTWTIVDYVFKLPD